MNCILLVDDHEPTNVLHKIVIKRTKKVDKVIDFLDAEAALNYLGSTYSDDKPKPDFIFLDINMPRINAWEFLKKYESLSQEQTADISVVIVSTSKHPEDIKRAEESEIVQHYVPKPLTKEAFLKVINNSLENFSVVSA